MPDFAFVPSWPQRKGEISFAQAYQAAAAYGFPIQEPQIRESATWFYFPVLQIGCIGVVVDRRSGEATALGSGQGFELKDWLFLYERGYLQLGDVRIDAVSDFDKSESWLRSARRVRHETRQDRIALLYNLPYLVSGVSLQVLLGLHTEDPGFTWTWIPAAPIV
jgi:hypothetical protein